MEKFEVAIEGNGIIGTLAALRIAETGTKVALVGPAGRPGSASLAAGAMLNVYGEVDSVLDAYAKRKLEIGQRGIALWKAMLPPDVFVADRTHVYRKHGGTQLESDAFDAIVAASERPIQKLADRDIVTLDDEPAVNTPELFAWLDRKLDERGVVRSEKPQNAKKIIKCAGAATVAQGMIPLFYGIGNAMTIAGIELNVPPRSVVRTPNRGNTCGLHIVPRGNGYYIGAGSYLASEPSDGFRIETLRYLVDCLEEDFGVDTYQASIHPIKGYRPVSIDGKPLLGPLRTNPDTYVASGTKRDGLTYAPVIVEDILAWLGGQPRNVFDGWEPDRQFISFGPREYAIQVYIDNRLAALHEHGRIMSQDEARKHAEHVYERAHSKYNLPVDFGIHPEVLSVI